MERPFAMDHDRLPVFLRTQQALADHLDAHFADRSNKDKGDTFLDVVLHSVPLTEVGRRFSDLQVSEKHSHDEGVDISSAQNENGETLYVQSKYKIRQKIELDGIISKFKSFEVVKSAAPQGQLLLDPKGPRPNFMIVTSSDLTEILRLYKESELASKEYYNILMNEGRLSLFHGPDFLKLLRYHYMRANAVPTELTISSSGGWLKSGGAYIGIVKGNDIKTLHSEFGEALFFENIRDFLGVSPEARSDDRTSVNHEISQTILLQPSRMLEKNNGIVFRASNVQVVDDKTLTLSDPNIVNGCQTTMCLALSPQVDEACHVAVKIVETNDAWDITKSANSQNQIRRIELEFAKFLRPQLLRRAASDLGFGYTEGAASTARLILNSVYRDHVDYEELKSLYIGLFSTRPGNIFSNNYIEVRYDIIENLMVNEDIEKYTFNTVFLLAKRTQDAVRDCERALDGTQFTSLFKRFFKEEKPAYRIYLTILAICAAVGKDISERDGNLNLEVNRTNALIRKIRSLIENKPKIFNDIYKQAFLVIAESTIEFDTEREIQARMHDITKRSFKVNLQKLQLKLQMSSLKTPVV